VVTANALQLEGLPTSRQLFWTFLANLYCACALTANSQLSVKTLTSLLDSAVHCIWLIYCLQVP